MQTLIDAAAAVTDEVGIEHVTTNLVAEHAGCSIGTFYRYFPDRVAILRALALRHVSTVHEDCQAALALVTPNDEGLELALVDISERMIERFRTEPGWGAIGFAHTPDVAVLPTEIHLVAPPLRAGRTPRQQIARDIAIRFTTDDAQLPELSQHIEVALLLLQTLIDRVFAESKSGDEAALAMAREAFAIVTKSVASTYREQQLAAATKRVA